MSMVCPQCNGTFNQQMQCPTCRVRLLYQAGRSAPGAILSEQGGQWQHTPWGRVVVGLLLALGLYFGLHQLVMAGWLAVGETNSEDVWTTLYGLLLLQGLQGFSLLVGGILAGAGQRRGFFLGAILGLWSGIILMLVDQVQARTSATGAQVGQSLPLTAMTAYGQLLLLTAFGAVGGLIGGLIWKPLPALALPGAKADAGKVNFKRGPKRSLLSGPIAWPRVVMGIAVTVCGATWANVILRVILKALDEKIKIDSTFQLRLVTLEVCALAILIGSGLAGATTSNGFKQGLVVGLGATAVLLGIALSKDQVSVDYLLYTGLSTSALSLAGGWFGGQLFPPIVAPPRQRRFLTETAT
jgi:hypothetical protein